MVRIAALNVYPVKSCKGIALDQARMAITGIEHDRQWLIVKPNGQFVTQREQPRLALVRTALTQSALELEVAGLGAITIPFDHQGTSVEVTCWRDRCAAFDAGDEAAAWLEAHLGTPHRLVRFDPSRKRPASADWTAGVEALNQFSDGFPFLVIGTASLDDLNTRLEQPLPMNRFRPNIVIEGLPAYAEDDVHELSGDGVVLRIVKPCARCAITTTDQVSGARVGDEPLRTLRSYRFSRELKGVLFGQNVILVRGAGRTLRVGEELETVMKSAA